MAEPAARSEAGAAASNSEVDETSAVYDVWSGPIADMTRFTQHPWPAAEMIVAQQRTAVLLAAHRTFRGCVPLFASVLEHLSGHVSP